MSKNEEAWEAVKEKTAQLRTGARQRRPSAAVDVQEDNVMEAVRAGFLVVMEEALMAGSADHIDDFDTGAEALRREIEELR